MFCVGFIKGLHFYQVIIRYAAIGAPRALQGYTSGSNYGGRHASPGRNKGVKGHKKARHKHARLVVDRTL